MSPLDLFGEILMRDVRDETIEYWQKLTAGTLKGVDPDLAAKLETGEISGEKVSMLVPAVVDTCIHHLLQALEHKELLTLSVQTEGEGGQNIVEESDGLSGELYGRRGWVARFSRFEKSIV